MVLCWLEASEVVIGGIKFGLTLGTCHSSVSANSEISKTLGAVWVMCESIGVSGKSSSSKTTYRHYLFGDLGTYILYG